MPETLVHMPDGTVLHFPEGVSPETMQLAASRHYGDQQAAGAQQHTLESANPQPQSALARFFQPILPSEKLSDYVTGPAHALMHPIDSAKLIGSAIASDPIGAIPVVGNAKRGYEDAKSGNYAGAAGEGAMGLLQLLGGVKLAPEGTGSAIARGTGSTISAAGRGAEALGDSRLVKSAVGRWGSAGELIRGNPMTAVGMAAAPTILDYGGKGLQKLGNSIRALGAIAPETADATSMAEAPMAAAKAEFAGMSPEDVAGLRKQNYSDAMIQRMSDSLSGNTGSGPSSSRLRPQSVAVKPEGSFTRQPKAEVVEPTAESARRPSTAEQDNIDAHSSFGEGHVLPEQLPTELRDAANDGLDFPPRGTFNIETGKLESALDGLGKPEAAMPQDQQFTDWSKGMDDIINQASPEEAASSSPTGLGRSRLTNSWKDWIQKRGQSTPGWPFKEVLQ